MSDLNQREQPRSTARRVPALLRASARARWLTALVVLLSAARLNAAAPSNEWLPCLSCTDLQAAWGEVYMQCEDGAYPLCGSLDYCAIHSETHTMIVWWSCHEDPQNWPDCWTFDIPCS